MGVFWENLNLLIELSARAAFSRAVDTAGTNVRTTFGRENRNTGSPLYCVDVFAYELFCAQD
jgi:hypothetical protein